MRRWPNCRRSPTARNKLDGGRYEPLRSSPGPPRQRCAEAILTKRTRKAQEAPRGGARQALAQNSAALILNGTLVTASEAERFWGVSPDSACAAKLANP